jgi:hypothetical protein
MQKTVLRNKKDKAIKNELSVCLQSSPIIPWKNIIHLNAMKNVENSSQSIADPNKTMKFIVKREKYMH